MSNFADTFAACFSTTMPGVVSMTWHGGEMSASVQYFSEPTLDAEGYTQVQRRAYRVQGLTSAIGGLLRGDVVTIACQDYRCVSNAIDDGFGVSEIHLEATAA
jgi:hypothetical protein